MYKIYPLISVKLVDIFYIGELYSIKEHTFFNRICSLPTEYFFFIFCLQIYQNHFKKPSVIHGASMDPFCCNDSKKCGLWEGKTFERSHEDYGSKEQRLLDGLVYWCLLNHDVVGDTSSYNIEGK